MKNAGKGDEKKKRFPPALNQKGSPLSVSVFREESLLLLRSHPRFLRP